MMFKWDRNYLSFFNSIGASSECFLKINLLDPMGEKD